MLPQDGWHRASDWSWSKETRGTLTWVQRSGSAMKVVDLLQRKIDVLGSIGKGALDADLGYKLVQGRVILEKYTFFGTSAC